MDCVPGSRTDKLLGMRILGVIPARYGSTRFPGKPLTPILGKPLIQWVIEGAKTSGKINEVIVATDDERIAAVAIKSGVEAVMTDPNLPSGTDRIWAAVQDRPGDIILNIQGDEPLINADVLEALITPFASDASVEMATLAKPLSALSDLDNTNVVKVICNKDGDGIYFSRFPIPFSRGPRTEGVSLHHLGLYAFKKAFLRRFVEAGEGHLEKAEALEQLRALQLGGRIRVVKVNHESRGVDTPDDVVRIEEVLKSLRGGSGGQKGS